ncbi:MAG TPA: DUF2254 domain-containing protein [Longimicrobium sp.]|jgi:uncharacterized membrane protein|uniref:DUF2254 domain-containing protein n=1 Tax=Longimicrobium sp. TaxID=2029185 RepID=UPI002EDB16F2
MKIKLRHALASLRSTYWFIPALMAGAAGILGLVSVQVDRYLAHRYVDELSWVYSGGAEGARAVLGVVAGSVMSTAGVTFSITIAALSLASTQLGPRLLHTFMRDVANQVVLGTFIATFVFCLLVLRTIQGEDDGGRFVPALSVTAGVGLGLASLGVLIFFIHHVAVSIQAPNVVAGVGRELARQVERAFPTPERVEASPPAATLPPDFDARAALVGSAKDGYVQVLDEDALVKIAARTGTTLVVELRPGQFAAEGAALVRAWPPEAMSPDLARDIRRRFVVGTQRTAEQDVEFAVDQLAEVAVRALSPAINDPFTAIACLDWLGAGLCRAARGRTARTQLADEGGTVRVIYRNGYTFAGLIDAAFNQIRQFGARSPAVMLRMLETLEAVVRCTGGDRDEIQTLLQHARMVHRAALEATPEPRDRADLDRRFTEVLRICGAHDAGDATPETA